ncbi:hypothetical protein ES288_D09G067000v1 [Gossypium darwinii]|uniref:Copia protein n=1 Tax=Gossypium darwinii TaxID=34276 RepID=A0A5D2B9D3_GOSDA|nr:hypothetical protein ES288_D09G067000v1 [Gossypium darwinii]
MKRNLAFHGKTKHIDVYHHFIRKLATDEKIMLKLYSTNEQIADAFTKSLSHARHQFFKSLLGVCDFESRGKF